LSLDCLKQRISQNTGGEETQTVYVEYLGQEPKEITVDMDIVFLKSYVAKSARKYSDRENK